MARKECENYKKNFGVPAPVCVVADRIGYIMQVYTTYGAVRPFGVSVMIFGYDLQLKKYELYSMDATGLVIVYCPLKIALFCNRHRKRAECSKNRNWEIQNNGYELRRRFEICSENVIFYAVF